MSARLVVALVALTVLGAACGRDADVVVVAVAGVGAAASRRQRASRPSNHRRGGPTPGGWRPPRPLRRRRPCPGASWRRFRDGSTTWPDRPGPRRPPSPSKALPSPVRWCRWASTPARESWRCRRSRTSSGGTATAPRQAPRGRPCSPVTSTGMARSVSSSTCRVWSRGRSWSWATPTAPSAASPSSSDGSSPSRSCRSRRSSPARARRPSC